MLSQFNNPIKIVQTIKNNKLNAKISLRKEKLEDLINAKRFKNLNEAKVFDFITFYSSLNIAEEELNFIKQIDSETPDINQINDYIKFAKGNNISNTNTNNTLSNNTNHLDHLNQFKGIVLLRKLCTKENEIVLNNNFNNIVSILTLLNKQNINQLILNEIIILLVFISYIFDSNYLLQIIKSGILPKIRILLETKNLNERQI